MNRANYVCDVQAQFLRLYRCADNTLDHDNQCLISLVDSKWFKTQRDGSALTLVRCL